MNGLAVGKQIALSPSHLLSNKAPQQPYKVASVIGSTYRRGNRDTRNLSKVTQQETVEVDSRKHIKAWHKAELNRVKVDLMLTYSY